MASTLGKRTRSTPPPLDTPSNQVEEHIDDDSDGEDIGPMPIQESRKKRKGYYLHVRIRRTLS